MPPFKVLSWGCGLQSTLLGELSAQGEIDHLDLIVNADPGWERQATYDIRDFYAERWHKMGMDVDVINTGDIRLDGAKRHIHIPFAQTQAHRCAGNAQGISRLIRSSATSARC